MSISHTIRRWAATNKRAAQGLIVLSTLTLFFLGHVLGVLAEMLGWDPYAIFLIGAGMGILAWTLAPRRGDTFPIRYTYARQKVSVVIMLTSLCVGIGGGAICLEQFSEPIDRALKNVQVEDFKNEAAIGPTFFQETTKKATVNHTLASWFHGGISKRVTKQVRLFLKKYVPKKNNLAGQILATFFSLALAITLGILLVHLSCSIACSGNEALALLLLVGGYTILIVVLIKTLDLIYQKPKMEKRKKTELKPDM